MEAAEEAVVTERLHDEQCVHYTHEMPYEVKESVGRVIIRLVPLLYGGMFGSLLDDMPLALTVAALVSAGMDLAMGRQSILRTVGGSLFRGGCPVIAFMANGLADLVEVIGLNPPPVLRNMRCRVS